MSSETTYLTPREADELLRLRPGTSARLARQGSLPAVLLPWRGHGSRPERTIRFDRDALLRHLATGSTGVNGRGDGR